MQSTRWLGMVAFVLASVYWVGARPVFSQDEFGKRATWAAPTVETVRGELERWLATQTIGGDARQQIVALWPVAEEQLDGQELLERFVETVAIVVPPVRQIQKAVHGTVPVDGIPAFEILSETATPPLVRNNLRLYVGRWLAQQAYYDEALENLEGLAPADVLDPAALLFYQSVAYHRLLAKDKCLPVLTKLMENEKAIPRRYLTLAKLMEADLAPLKPDSLDEIARLMDDVRRRLDFGRAGTKVRQEEDDVIAKLDKMIEDLESQLQKQQQPGGGGGATPSPSSPRPDSTPGGIQGPGNVDPKNIGSRSGWGDLPAKQRQEALQQISKDLPSHYREAIEEYFRKLARDNPKK